jgi:hypothetical protein
MVRRIFETVFLRPRMARAVRSKGKWRADPPAPGFERIPPE